LPELGMTVAQLPPSLKNELSHRAKAFQKLKSTCKNTFLLK
jgi:inosine/xanthosine triphosphate pyrophosphatase family protein